MSTVELGPRSLFQLKKERTLKEDELLFLGFSVGEQSYAAKIPFIREILRIPKLYSMPKVPPFVKGVMDMRGVILPVTDLKERLDQGSVDPKKGRVIVLSMPKCQLGILVDLVTEVFSVVPEEVKSSPGIFNQPHMDFIEGMVKHGERLYYVLSPENILTPKEMRTLETQKWDKSALPAGE